MKKKKKIPNQLSPLIFDIFISSLYWYDSLFLPRMGKTGKSNSKLHSATPRFIMCCLHTSVSTYTTTKKKKKQQENKMHFIA